jgi:stage V sporulation protein K
MSKRRYDKISDPKKEKKKRYRIKLEDTLPSVNCIADLIEIGKSKKFYKNIDSLMLFQVVPYLEKLNNLIGMDTLKESIFYQVIYYLQNLHRRNNEEYLHTVITGRPGSGKTTVAKIIGKIYQSMGVLSKYGVFKIAYRDDFIAEYLGQTALKTRKLLNSCIGGVLFIDEVYSLAPRGNDKDSFSKEALDTLTAFLSENKNNFCCIAAGYEKDINECFFSMNSGLQRRFPWVHKIEEYKTSELTSIFIKMLKDIKWDLGTTKESINQIFEKNKKLFKYAGGDIETFITKCKMVHAKRVFNLGKDHKFVITSEDLQKAIVMLIKNKKEIQSDLPPDGMYM